MLEDALLDLTNRGDIVIDPFLGSGSTLIAADRTGRVCRGVELDPLYVNVVLRRYEAATGNTAVLIETGESFDAVAARRAREATPSRRRAFFSAQYQQRPVPLEGNLVRRAWLQYYEPAELPAAVYPIESSSFSLSPSAVPYGITRQIF